jgi:hypothetical protein
MTLFIDNQLVLVTLGSILVKSGDVMLVLTNKLHMEMS